MASTSSEMSSPSTISTQTPEAGTTVSAPNSETVATPETKTSPAPDVSTPESSKYIADGREVIVDSDINLFEAWFEVMNKNEKGKVNVEELAEKVSTSGLFTFNNNPTTLIRKMEEKAVKEELLDLIDEDLSLNVLGWISIRQFFKVIVRFPRYVHRLKRAAGDVSDAPKVWEKPDPLTFEEETEDLDEDIFQIDEHDSASEKQLRRVTWRAQFKELFKKSTYDRKKKKPNPKQLTKQSSSFYDKIRSVRAAFMGKTSSVKVFNSKEEMVSE